MRMNYSGGGSAASDSFLEQRLARRKRMLKMVMRRFGCVETYGRTRRGGAST